MRSSYAARQIHRFFVTFGFLFLLFPAEQGRAQGPDFTLGIRSWYSDWSFEQAGEVRADMDPSLLIGPSATLRVNRFSIGASYLFGTFGSVLSVPQGDFDVDFRRRDLDLYVAYRLHRYFNATVGYKRFKYIARYVGDDILEVASNGVGAGFTFSRSFDGGLVLSSSANALLMSTSVEDVRERHFGFNAEANIGYRFRPDLPIPFVGYRFQSIGGSHEDRFDGLTFSMLYQF
jgi:hypothetical protein